MKTTRRLINNSTLFVNNSLEGESIEAKVCRIVNNGEPISDGAPLIYTERKDGVKEEYNIRTDRFDIALKAMDYVTASSRAKRDNFGKPETIQGTNSDNVS